MDSPIGRAVQDCIKRTRWDELRRYASRLHSSDIDNDNDIVSCTLGPSITNGLHHLVPTLEFADGAQWVARIQLAPSTPELAAKMQVEVDTMSLLRERTEVPIPKVFGYEVDTDNPVGVAFMLTEFLPGMVAMEADGGFAVHRAQIPAERRPGFYSAVAEIQVQITSVRLPKIGTVVKLADGSYGIGPLPVLGGPFETATAFFEAWAEHTKFPHSTDIIQEVLSSHPPEYTSAVLASLRDFPAQIKVLASRIPGSDAGPFPVMHPDFFHSNIMVDSSYNILGVIDWEGASTVPWELVEFPLFLDAVPISMDRVPSNYDADGNPVDEGTKQRWKERKKYVEMVEGFERARNRDTQLSSALKNRTYQGLSYGMRVYREPGKLTPLYSRVLEPFRVGNKE
ncbi:hypothetical protein B0H63DRAFT_441835 [Podospora didyma]|uniref:Aminoglycoside phosphotransferase domain-containing protein n=1 Tax=Podospora didyma TaxID=330526 RepID=A0AAE0N401_9PEZI|nr:hypothetical protein B0H63DRAFT_441835 [Podospora didyma]